jgi:hypothetical protein
MKLYILKNIKNVHDDRLFNLYKKNYNHDIEFTPEYRYNMVLKFSDMWYHLINDNDDIIGCCSVSLKNGYYKIDDVYIEENFRGNNYSLLLLMNVLYLHDDINNKFILQTSISNIPAIKTYEKIFGKGKKYKEQIFFIIE